MMDFADLKHDSFALRNVSIPGCLLGKSADLVQIDLAISGGKFVDPKQVALSINMKGAMVLPPFVDMHTHLDKGHIWPRSPNPNGTFQGAIETVGADRQARWTAEDVRARMEFSLKCAYAHGTRAIRTHLDSVPPQDDITWPVFCELRAEWAGRIALQGVCLIGCEGFSTDGPFRHTAQVVKDSGGVLGMVTYPVPDLKERLDAFFDLAAELDLPVDFHVDETLDPNVETLRMIAEAIRAAKIRTGYDQPVVVGHCCSLSTQDEARAMDTLDLVASSKMYVVSLPLCNLYLQDRQEGRTPRYRGITLVHEMKARGIPVAFASDNTRDPFYAYGDMDMLEVLREATRIGHLDHSEPDWIRSVNEIPADIGFGAPTLILGAPADMLIFKARNWNELFARPQSDRIVVRNGRQIDRTLPDYAELDVLMEKTNEPA
ncbi:MAG: cytosine deaminase [Paracoccaceae bacterium]